MDSIEVIIGTYENIILGYKSTPDFPTTTKTPDEKKNRILETSFTDDNHRGVLRCLSISPSGVLASSSTDDSVRLHSLRKRREVGSLFQHSGTVNTIVFFGKSHMFTASEDGTICMWKSKNWELMRTLKGHKSKVMSFAVHPSGKLGFSVGSDKSLLTWDLLTGKLAFQRKISEVAESIHFTNSGDSYILQYPRKVELCDIEDTKTITDVELQWRINSITLLDDDHFVVGGEDRNVLVFNLKTGKQVLSLDCASEGSADFNSRVKSVRVLQVDETSTLIFVGIAQGNIKAFKIDPTKLTTEAEMVLNFEAKVRLTCMAVYSCGSTTQTLAKKEMTTCVVEDNKIEEAESEEENNEDDADKEEDDEEAESEEEENMEEEKEITPKHKNGKRNFPKESSVEHSTKKQKLKKDSSTPQDKKAKNKKLKKVK